MAIFKSLGALISQSLRNHSNSASSRTLFTFSYASASPIPTPFLQSGCIGVRRHFLFRSRFLLPFGGPLFLSNPPWKLSQSATPLLLQSDAVLNYLKVRALDLIHRPAFPGSLGHEYDARKLLNGGCREEFRNGAEINVAVSVNEFSDSYLNLPNLISFARMASGPFIGWMIVHDMYSSAFVSLAISGASDWLDGYLARRMKINSVVGSYLDPLADKVLIGCVALAMVEKGLLHPGLVGLVLARDIALVGGAVYKRGSNLNWEWNSWCDFFNLDHAHVQKIEPLMISKVNTVFQLALVAAALVQPGFGNEETQLYVNYLSWLVVSTTLASTAAYGAQHLKSKAGLIKSSRSRN